MVLLMRQEGEDLCSRTISHYTMHCKQDSYCELLSQPPCPRDDLCETSCTYHQHENRGSERLHFCAQIVLSWWGGARSGESPGLLRPGPGHGHRPDSHGAEALPAPRKCSLVP